MDDAYLGGVRSGGKRGRGAAGKTPFVAAVSTSPEGRPRKLKPVPVKGFRKREIARGEQVDPGAHCRRTAWAAGAHSKDRLRHQASAPGAGLNTMLGNIKCAITGTYRKLPPITQARKALVISGEKRSPQNVLDSSENITYLFCSP